MNKPRIFEAFFLSCLSFMVHAQEVKWTADPRYFDNIRHREIMMNMTPMIAQFVPFNASTLSKFNIFDFEVRKLKNGKGTHWALGVNVDGGFNPSEPQSIYLKYGFIKREQITSRFHFARSVDVNLVAEDVAGNSVAKKKLDFSGFAISYTASLEYTLNSRLAISTEGMLFLGLLNFDNGSPKIKFIPPVGLFLHVKL